MPHTRIGLVGAGRIAQVAHLPALTRASGVALTGLTDANDYVRTEVAARYGVAAHPTLEALLASDIDAVVVAVPDRLHLACAREALRAGKHVLVEKPIGQTVKEGEALIAEAAERELVLQVGSMRRHDPGMQFAKANLDRIGPILSAQYWYRVMDRLRPAVEDTFFPEVIMDPAVRAAENALKSDRDRYLLVTHGAHVFDTIRNLVDDVDQVSADVARVGDDFTWHGRARIVSSGGFVSFELSANVHSPWSEGFDLHGEHGSISVRTPFPFTRQASTVSVFTEDDCLSVSPDFGAADPYRRQLEYFADAIATGGPGYPDGREGVEAVRLLERVAESAAGRAGA